MVWKQMKTSRCIHKRSFFFLTTQLLHFFYRTNEDDVKVTLNKTFNITADTEPKSRIIMWRSSRTWLFGVLCTWRQWRSVLVCGWEQPAPPAAASCPLCSVWICEDSGAPSQTGDLLQPEKENRVRHSSHTCCSFKKRRRSHRFQESGRPRPLCLTRRN